MKLFAIIRSVTLTLHLLVSLLHTWSSETEQRVRKEQMQAFDHCLPVTGHALFQAVGHTVDCF